APTIVTDDCEGGSECPLDPCRANLLCCDLPNLPYQLRIVCASQPNVMRKYSCTHNIVVTVHSVRSPHRRNWMRSMRGIHRRVIEPIGECQPLTRWGKFVIAR